MALRFCLLLVWVGVLACEARPPEVRAGVRACRDYARAFAEGAATRCGRGSYEANLDGFYASSGVGSSCELVEGVRDDASLREVCLPWLVERASCELFDDPRAYLDALPEGCQAQLQLAVP